MRRSEGSERHRCEHRTRTRNLADEFQHAAGHRADNALVAFVAGKRSVFSKARNRAVDERWVLVCEIVVADPEAVSESGPEALDDHVRMEGQLSRPAPSGSGLEIHHYAFLRSIPLQKRWLRTPWIALRGFDFDDFCTVVCHHHARHAEHAGGEIKDA
ncbi:MAG: hypothetical protein ABIQ73_07020 [Acidimicrobiales bacterium]